MEWAWMGGSLTPLGVYGQQGVPSPSNMLSARYRAAIWYESSTRELWVFGGFGLGNVTLEKGPYFSLLQFYCL